jgi:cytochrome c oxidase cbb3-type subunit 3
MSRGRAILIMVGLAVLAGVAFAGVEVGEWRQRQALMRQYPDRIRADPELFAHGASLGRAAYSQHCASCHGAELQGDPNKGAPNLADAVWLYGKGEVSEIERTILYGIRSGHAKGRNVNAMPGLGVLKILTPQEVDDVVAYTLSLSSRQGDPAVLARGEAIFQGKGSCIDCHAPDGKGNADFGAPDLTDSEWTFGGDPASVRKSVYDGRRGLCPAFARTLDYATIRGLALYLYQMSHPEPG